MQAKAKVFSQIGGNTYNHTPCRETSGQQKTRSWRALRLVDLISHKHWYRTSLSGHLPSAPAWISLLWTNLYFLPMPAQCDSASLIACALRESVEIRNPPPCLVMVNKSPDRATGPVLGVAHPASRTVMVSVASFIRSLNRQQNALLGCAKRLYRAVCLHIPRNKLHDACDLFTSLTNSHTMPYQLSRLFRGPLYIGSI